MITRRAQAFYEVLQMLATLLRQETVIEVAGHVEILSHAVGEGK